MVPLFFTRTIVAQEGDFSKNTTKNTSISRTQSSSGTQLGDHSSDLLFTTWPATSWLDSAVGLDLCACVFASLDPMTGTMVISSTYCRVTGLCVSDLCAQDGFFKPFRCMMWGVASELVSPRLSLLCARPSTGTRQRIKRLFFHSTGTLSSVVAIRYLGYLLFALGGDTPEGQRCLRVTHLSLEWHTISHRGL